MADEGTISSSRSPEGIRWAWAGLLCALTALPMWSEPVTHFGFEPNKARLAVLLVLGGSGLAFLLDPGGMRARMTVLWRSFPMPARIGLAGLLVLALLAPLWSLQGSWSVWGSPHRGFGIFTHLALTAGIFIGGMLAQSPGGWQTLRWTVVLAGSWVGAAGVWWALGWPLPKLWQGDPFSGRVFAGLGNPDFLGSFLVLALPVMGLELWMARRARRMQYAGWLAFWVGIALWLLWRSGARGAWLGLGTAGALVITLVSARRRHMAGTALGVTASLLLAVFTVWILAKGLALPGLAGWLDPTGSGRQRGQFWGEIVSFLGHGVTTRQLVLGYGPDAQGLVLPNYLAYRAPMVGEAGPVLLDRAHNVLLDTVLTQGAVGLACWAFLGVGSLMAGLRALAPRIPWSSLIRGGAAGAAVVLAALAWNLPPAYWPVAVGMAIPAGIAAGSAAAVWRASSAEPFRRGGETVIVVLSALVGHGVDLMVGFGTVGVSMLAYALLGVLLAGQAGGQDAKAPAREAVLPALTGVGLTALLAAAGEDGGLDLLPLMMLMGLAGVMVYIGNASALSWRGAAVCSLMPAILAGAGMHIAEGDPRGQLLAGGAGVLVGMTLTAVTLRGDGSERKRPACALVWRLVGALILVSALVGAGWPAAGDAYVWRGRQALFRGSWADVDKALGAAVHLRPYDALAFDLWAQRWIAISRLEASQEERCTALERAAQMLKAAWDHEPRQVEWARRLSAVYREWAECEDDVPRRRELLFQARDVLGEAVTIAPANRQLADDLRAVDSLLQEIP